MPVIALTQEMGSLAKDVALRLAQVGGLEVMRNEVAETTKAEKVAVCLPHDLLSCIERIEREAAVLVAKEGHVLHTGEHFVRLSRVVSCRIEYGHLKRGIATKRPLGKLVNHELKLIPIFGDASQARDAHAGSSIDVERY